MYFLINYIAISQCHKIKICFYNKSLEFINGNISSFWYDEPFIQILPNRISV